MNLLTKCPVCSKKYLTRSVKMHIINTARGEAANQLMNMLKYTRKPYNFSPFVIYKNNLHIKFVKQHTLLKEKFIIK